MAALVRFFKTRWILSIIVTFATAIVVARAGRQSITVDEADTFLLFAWRSEPLLWFNSPNNHVLNTLLEMISVHVFGASQFTIRIPALLGAVIYISSCFAICDRFVRGVLGRVTVAALVFNPFILDYLVAARGYALALGFLMATLLCLLVIRESEANRIRLSSLASLAVGLSISSNFSFGIVDVCLLTAFGLIVVLRARNQRIQIAAALAIPAPLIALLICGPALTKFSSSELVYGANSIGEMLASIVTSSFDGPNPYVVNPLVMPAFQALRIIAPILIALGIVVAVFESFRRHLLAKSASLLVLGTVVVALPIQIVIAEITHTPFPLNRTLLAIAPLITVGFALSAVDVGSKILLRYATISLFATSLFFISSVRSYFREWALNAHVAETYSVLRTLVAHDPSLRVGSTSEYTSALNFYQSVDPAPAFPKIDNKVPDFSSIPEDRDVYVLTAGVDDKFLAKRGLKVVYSFPGDGLPATEIAVRRSLELSVPNSVP